MNPFEFVKSINTGKDADPEDIDRHYNSFLTNRAFSYHKDSVLFANELNIYNFSPSRAKFKYYSIALRPRPRYSKWFKPAKDEEIDMIQEHYKCNRDRAIEYKRILTPEQIDKIKNKKGGKP